MRSDQYIGLTDRAREFVKDAEVIETRQIGAAFDSVSGKVYKLPTPKGPNVAWIAKEEIQISPWSSGPMFFTHLHIFLIKECGQEIDEGYAYSWVWDPILSEEEFNSEKGTYNL